MFWWQQKKHRIIHPKAINIKRGFDRLFGRKSIGENLGECCFDKLSIIVEDAGYLQKHFILSNRIDMIEELYEWEDEEKKDG